MNSKKFKRLCEEYNQRQEEKKRREAVLDVISVDWVEEEGENGGKKEGNRGWRRRLSNCIQQNECALFCRMRCLE